MDGYFKRLQEALTKIPTPVIVQRMGVHENTVYNWRNGKTEMGIGSFVRLIEEFDLDANYIVKGIKTEKEKPYGYKHR